MPSILNITLLDFPFFSFRLIVLFSLQHSGVLLCVWLFCVWLFCSPFLSLSCVSHTHSWLVYSAAVERRHFWWEGHTNREKKKANQPKRFSRRDEEQWVFSFRRAFVNVWRVCIRGASFSLSASLVLSRVFQFLFDFFRWCTYSTHLFSVWCVCQQIQIDLYPAYYYR